MATNQLKLTPAMAAYLIALIYRNTRTSCLSLAAVCAHVSHDRLQRMLYTRFAWSRRLWDYFAARMVRGHQVVLLIWTDGRVRVPLGMRLWQKGGASKVELAAQL